MQRDRFGYAMHGEVADDVARIQTGLLHASVLECDLGKFPRGKEIRAAQMRVTFCNTGIDALHLNCRRNGRFLGMLAIKFDRPAKLFEAARYCSDSLVHCETDSRVCGVDLKNLVPNGVLDGNDEKQCAEGQARDRRTHHLKI